MSALVGEESPYTQPELSSAALVTIDVQRDTLPDGALEVAGTVLRTVATAFRRRSLPIIHIVVVEGAISGIYRRGLEELVGIGGIPMSATGLVERLPGRPRQHDEQEGQAS